MIGVYIGIDSVYYALCSVAAILVLIVFSPAAFISMLHCLQYNFEIRTNIFLAILENAVLYLDILVLIVYGTALGASSRKLGEQHFR